MKESIIDIIFDSYLAAFVYIYLGYRIIKFTIKEVNKERSEYPYDFGGRMLQGFAGGIGFIVLGLLLIVGKLQGKI